MNINFNECDGYEVDLEEGRLNEVDIAYIDSQKLTVEETRIKNNILIMITTFKLFE
jgi:hypothetical protein